MTDSYVSNSKHFVEMMKDVLVDERKPLVSFDVFSLFTYVPIGEALDIIRVRLEEDESLGERTPLSPGRVAELLQVCLRSIFSVSMVNSTSRVRVQPWDLRSQQLLPTSTWNFLRD